jgi:hypothetical protein
LLLLEKKDSWANELCFSVIPELNKADKGQYIKEVSVAARPDVNSIRASGICFKSSAEAWVTVIPFRV